MDKFLEHNIGLREYITGNRFIDICANTGATFCKTDFLREIYDKNIKTLVTHNSDYHINDFVYSVKPPTVKRWFTQNKDVDSETVTSVPIGLENMILRVTPESQLGRFSSEVKNALLKAQIINRLFEKGVDKTKQVYMNFNPATAPVERNYVKNMFKDNPLITTAAGRTLDEYYHDVAVHKFVISPRGNGVDCHRTWEALYLRTIPIVRRSIHMNEFEDLPILFVDKWEDLSYINIEEKYEEMVSKEYDLGKMKISYWEDRIRGILNE